MKVPAKLAAFAAVLALLFAGGAFAGDLVGPEPTVTAAAPHDDTTSPASGEHTEKTPAGTGSHGAPRPVRGLAVAEDGLRVVVEDPELRRDRDERLAFRIVDEGGETVRDFDVEHTKRMHLIVVRRDMTGFQHLHPRQAADGTWSVPLTLRDAGSYRVFADFARDGEAHTLAGDLTVDGSLRSVPLPAPAPTAEVGGLRVRLDEGATRAGTESDLRFTVTRDGRPVAVQDYLGAKGHLVALREGDLAFLHVHPDERSLRFEATFPTAGRYRLFLQFRTEGRVHTAEFTQEVAR